MFDAEPVPVPATATRVTHPVRLRVPADMAMYAALAGKEPEIDPTLADPVIAAGEALREHPWSPSVLSNYLRQICREKATRINKPELSAWLRRQAKVARKRFAETQTRVIAAHKRVA